MPNERTFEMKTTLSFRAFISEIKLLDNINIQWVQAIYKPFNQFSSFVKKF